MNAKATPVTASTITVTPYQRRDLQKIHDLLFHSDRVHTHLDWQDTDSWIEGTDAVLRLAWYKGRLVGLMGLSRPLNRSTWIRLAAVQDFYPDAEGVLCALWSDLLQELREGLDIVALLVVRDWIIPFVPAMGFVYGEDIVTLSRAGYDLPAPLPEPPMIRVAEQRDLARLVEVDQTAFDPPWQMSREDIRQAYRVSSSCTVALKDEMIVGYQITTLYFDGAHLARLAVMPEMQGKGVGGALLSDLLRRFFRRGVYTMTVNTQASNIQSRNLYMRFGFQPNGYDLPYWSARL